MIREEERVGLNFSQKVDVRQRIMQEIISKLNYPEEMIEMEYPVQSPSGRSQVDIAVHHWNKDETEPYIFVKILQSGEDMEQAVKVLKSWISCTPTVRFAVVTDGVRTVMEKLQGNRYFPVFRLPAYEKRNQNRYWTYEYVNLKNMCRYDYRIEREDGHDIQIRQKGYQDILESRKYHAVPIIGAVAAGGLKPAFQEYLGEIRLPEEFGVCGEESFALTVDGDSMIDFDIMPGDYVIIKKQNYARTGDIVVAGKRSEDEVTLKKYYLTGNSVTLVPGNRDYASIVLPLQETYINGVAAGIMKKTEDSGGV